MKICEIFESLQGEGKYVGHPCLFIRTSGCTRSCDFCDTKYHINGKQMSVKDIIKIIKNSESDIVVWTGGEPMLFEDKIYEVISQTDNKYHHLETNGDILPQSPKSFNYICFSPKEKRVAENVYAYVMQLELNKCFDWDIKIVTDLSLNMMDMLEQATMLMPLTTGHKNKDIEIQQKVWNYCVKNKIKYTPRIHRDVWGSVKGI